MLRDFRTPDNFIYAQCAVLGINLLYEGAYDRRQFHRVWGRRVHRSRYATREEAVRRVLSVNVPLGDSHVVLDDVLDFVLIPTFGLPVCLQILRRHERNYVATPRGLGVNGVGREEYLCVWGFGAHDRSVHALDGHWYVGYPFLA